MELEPDPRDEEAPPASAPSAVPYVRARRVLEGPGTGGRLRWASLPAVYDRVRLGGVEVGLGGGLDSSSSAPCPTRCESASTPRRSTSWTAGASGC